MNQIKLISLSDAVERFVPDKSEVVMCTSFETLIPFGAGHELIRKNRRSLTLVGPISDMLFDQLTAAGCVKKIRAAWVGNAVTGLGYNFKKGIEDGTVKIEDHTNFTIAMALKAGAMGLPYMPSYTCMGSDLYKTNSSLKQVTCPFTGDRLTAVAAINPDVAVIHVQKADKYGNAVVWGNLGVTKDACLASDNVVITAEQIVKTDEILGDPNRIIVPCFRVSAVVHVPGGAFPSPVPGFYNRHHKFFADYGKKCINQEGFAKWRQKWIDNVDPVSGYQALVDKAGGLKLKHHLFSEPVDYGY